MATFNISLPDAMRAFVEKHAAAQGFSSISEYFRAIIREIQAREQQRAGDLERRQIANLQSLLAEMEDLPSAAGAKGFSSRDHDAAIYDRAQKSGQVGKPQ